MAEALPAAEPTALGLASTLRRSGLLQLFHQNGRGNVDVFHDDFDRSGARNEGSRRRGLALRCRRCDMTGVGGLRDGDSLGRESLSMMCRCSDRLVLRSNFYGGFGVDERRRKSLKTGNL